ncbi:hypothetical protein H1R20_g7712, partial [Candolleomyces eurysporus]
MPRAPTFKASELVGLKDKGMGGPTPTAGSLHAEGPTDIVAGADQIEALEVLVQKRAKLPQPIGRASYAHLALDNKMTKTPENVNDLLEALMYHTIRETCFAHFGSP